MRLDGFNKRTGIFIIVYHVLLIVAWALYFSYHTPSTKMVVTSIVLYFMTGLSITAGYHRYYAHTTYKTNRVVEAVLLFFASMATQASALRWAFEHRLHHAYVDTERDPYSVQTGFWHAHILWLFKKPAPIDNKVVADMLRNPLVVFQHNNYLFCMLSSNIIFFLLVGWALDDYLGAFVISWWTRLFCLHHSTWFINSLAHYWGERSFCRELSAVDNYIISLLTFGEGYHNYHHTFANDYRNGIRWYHFDPTKWLIWVLSRFGLASGLKQMNQYHIKERLVTEQRNEILQRIQESIFSRKEELIAYTATVTDGMIDKLNRARQLVEEYTKSKKNKNATPEALKRMKMEIKIIRKSIRYDWKQCCDFYKQVMKGRDPLPLIGRAPLVTGT